MESQEWNRPTLILASSSPRRQELVATLGLPVRIKPSRADESTPEGWTPERIVEQLAVRKARAVWEAEYADVDDPAVVIGSDTIVSIDGQVLGKPSDPEDAATMLARLSGRTHEVFTGLSCLLLRDDVADCRWDDRREVRLGETGRYRIGFAANEDRPIAAVGLTVSRVTFRPLSGREIERYVATGEPMDKAGAYGIQGLGALFVERIEGDYYSIMGLPLNMLYDMLSALGADVLGQ